MGLVDASSWRTSRLERRKDVVGSAELSRPDLTIASIVSLFLLWKLYDMVDVLVLDAAPLYLATFFFF